LRRVSVRSVSHSRRNMRQSAYRLAMSNLPLALTAYFDDSTRVGPRT
jgi:hypothetical protein